MLQRYIHDKIPSWADWAGLILFGLWVLDQKTFVVQAIKAHPLRIAIVIIALFAFVVWRVCSAERLATHQRNSVIAATQAVLRHLPSLSSGGANAQKSALDDLLSAYVRYYEVRFGGTTERRKWETSLWVPDKDADGTEFLRIKSSVGVSSAIVDGYFMGSKPPHHEGLAWWVWKNKQSVIVNSAETDDRVDQNHRNFDHNLRYQIKSLCCNLVEVQDVPYGVLVVDHNSARKFQDADLQFNRAYARLAAAVLSTTSNY